MTARPGGAPATLVVVEEAVDEEVEVVKEDALEALTRLFKFKESAATLSIRPTASLTVLVNAGLGLARSWRTPPGRVSGAKASIVAASKRAGA